MPWLVLLIFLDQDYFHLSSTVNACFGVRKFYLCISLGAGTIISLELL